MKDHSILENEAESARTNCPSCTNPARYPGSELSSLFIFLPLAFWVSGQQFDLLLSSPHSSSSYLWHWDSPGMHSVLQEAQLRDSGFLAANVTSNSVGNCPGGRSKDF